VVIGAGATGTEFVSLFDLMGVRVTWVVDEYGVLPTFDEEAGETIRQHFKHQGVRIVEPTTAERVTPDDASVTVQTSSGDCYRAATAFLAIGRSPDLDRLNLEAAGLDRKKGGSPPIDPYGRTAKPWIYLAGDASGSPMVANKAMAQAWVAGRHAAGATTSPFLPETVVKAVYSCPEVAEVGDLAGPYRFSVSYERALKSQLSNYAGFVKLTCDADRKTKGGVAVGPHASEVLAPVAVAIRAGLEIDDLAALFTAHPTLSELPFLAARTSRGWS
jgi:dihydrolipoamide dehydrogenase